MGLGPLGKDIPLERPEALFYIQPTALHRVGSGKPRISHTVHLLRPCDDLYLKNILVILDTC